MEIMDLFKIQINALYEKWPGILQESPLLMADGGFEVLKVVKVKNFLKINLNLVYYFLSASEIWVE